MRRIEKAIKRAVLLAGQIYPHFGDIQSGIAELAIFLAGLLVPVLRTTPVMVSVEELHVPDFADLVQHMIVSPAAIRFTLRAISGGQQYTFDIPYFSHQLPLPFDMGYLVRFGQAYRDHEQSPLRTYLRHSVQEARIRTINNKGYNLIQENPKYYTDMTHAEFTILEAHWAHMVTKALEELSLKFIAIHCSTYDVQARCNAYQNLVVDCNGIGHLTYKAALDYWFGWTP
jgi:hypothetical protein